MDDMIENKEFVYSIDFANMYPTSMTGINLVPQNIKKSHYILKSYPFTYNYFDISTLKSGINDWDILNIISNSKSFANKFLAEQCRLTLLIKYNHSATDIDALKNQLKTLEEDHPEWMI